MAKWTEDEQKKLEMLIEERLTSGQIADRFPTKSRSAVIGRAHRMGLKIKGGSCASTGKLKKTGWHKERVAAAAGAKTAGPEHKARRITKAAHPALRSLYQPAAEPFTACEEVVIPLCERKTLLQLEEHHCRWPIGDPQKEDFHFCGKTKVPGLPYCEGHSRRSYQPPQVKKPKREVVEETVSVAAETVPVVVKEVVEA